MDQPARNTQARYNVCPTDPVDTIVQQEGKRELVSMRWGLIPRWWNKSLKDAKMATFNARAETIETKPFSVVRSSAGMPGVLRRARTLPSLRTLRLHRSVVAIDEQTIALSLALAAYGSVSQPGAATRFARRG